MSKYTQKTLELYRDQGFMCQVVERWQPHSGRRIDLFGVVDIIALTPGKLIGIQSTSYAGRREHQKKIYDEHNLVVKWWLEAGNELLLVCWKKAKIKRGGVAFRYTPLIEPITLDGLLLNARKSTSDGSMAQAKTTKNQPD